MPISLTISHPTQLVIAIVVANEPLLDLAKLFGAEVEAARPLRIFHDRDAARAWLDRLAPLPPDRG
jgi:hypothetical protein